MPNIADYRALGQDVLSYPAPNIQYYLSQNPLGGSMASGIKAATVAASAAINTTETLLVRIPLVIPVTAQGTPGTLQVGSKVRITLEGTNTSSVANNSTFTIRAGTAGTTADASVGTAVVASAAAGTNIPFKAVIEFTVQTLGASGTCFGSLAVINNGTTGISTTATNVVALTTSTIATTTATWLDVTYVSAATTTTTTFNDCSIELIS